MAIAVEKIVARSEGIRMEAGSAAPAAARTPITPSGRIVTLDVLIARKRHIELVASPLWGFRRSSSIIALIPMGVAALPSPRALAAIFIIMADIAG